MMISFVGKLSSTAQFLRPGVKALLLKMAGLLFLKPWSRSFPALRKWNFSIRFDVHHECEAREGEARR
jgi:hypothetical protein